MSDESASDSVDDAAVSESDESEETAQTPKESGEASDASEEAADQVDEHDDSDDDETEESEETGISDDEFVRVSFTARSKESDHLVDTTDPAVAEDEGIDAEQESIKPRIVPIGAGHLFPSVEEAFIGKEVGDTGTVEVPPTEAFGEYRPDDVRTVSADTIPEDDRYPGAVVDVDGESGHVERIIGGRARVDFNHPLAGEAIIYEYEILDLVSDPVEQAKGMLEAIVEVEVDLWIQTDEVEEEVPVADDEEASDEDEPVETETELVEKRTLYVESVPQMAMNQRWLFSKRQIAQELIDRLELDRVVIQETIEGAASPFGGMPGMPEIDDVASAIEDVDPDAEDVDELDELIEEDDEE